MSHDPAFRQSSPETSSLFCQIVPAFEVVDAPGTRPELVGHTSLVIEFSHVKMAQLGGQWMVPPLVIQSKQLAGATGKASKSIAEATRDVGCPEAWL